MKPLNNTMIQNVTHLSLLYFSFHIYDVTITGKTTQLTPLTGLFGFYHKYYSQATLIIAAIFLFPHTSINAWCDQYREDNTVNSTDAPVWPVQQVLQSYNTLLLLYSSFHIYDVTNTGKTTQLTPLTGLFGLYDKYYSHTSAGVGDYMTSENSFKLQYTGSPTLTFSGFRVLITAFKGTDIIDIFWT